MLGQQSRWKTESLVFVRVGSAGTAADWTAGTEQGFVHDLADRARAAAALSTATKAAIDLTGRARRTRVHGGAHFMVGQDVAGTDDHLNPAPFYGFRPENGHFATGFMDRSQRKTQFRIVVNY